MSVTTQSETLKHYRISTFGPLPEPASVRRCVFQHHCELQTMAQKSWASPAYGIRIVTPSCRWMFPTSRYGWTTIVASSYACVGCART